MKKMKLEHLKLTFPILTETNQHFILGIAEGLKHAQEKNGKTLKKKAANYEKSNFYAAEKNCHKEV